MNIKIDEILRTKRRTITLQITSDGRLVIHAPLKTPRSLIERAVQQKSGWVLQKQNEISLKNQKYPPKRCVEGEAFRIFGDDYSLTYSDTAKEVFAKGGKLFVPERFRDNARVYIEKFYKSEAKRVLFERVAYYSAMYKIKYESVKITSALSRWGSCSSKGRLCFTWRLAMAPVLMIDYVVVHELSHIDHLDHSKAFWQRVGELMPDYTARREWFRNNSFLLRKNFFEGD